jgi:single-stranded DNA-binding protein
MNVVAISGLIGNMDGREAGEHLLLKISVAVNAGKDKTTWIPVEIWDKTAQFVDQYFAVGKPIDVSGELCIDQYTNDKGEKKTRAYVRAHRVWFTPTSGVRKEKKENGELPF